MSDYDRRWCRDCGNEVTKKKHVSLPTGERYCKKCWPARKKFLATVRAAIHRKYTEDKHGLTRNP